MGSGRHHAARLVPSPACLLPTSRAPSARRAKGQALAATQSSSPTEVSNLRLSQASLLKEVPRICRSWSSRTILLPSCSSFIPPLPSPGPHLTITSLPPLYPHLVLTLLSPCPPFAFILSPLWPALPSPCLAPSLPLPFHPAAFSPPPSDPLRHFLPQLLLASSSPRACLLCLPPHRPHFPPPVQPPSPPVPLTPSFPQLRIHWP